VTPARLPTPHINSKQRLDGKTRVAFEAKIPRLGPLQSARRLQAYDLQETGILISAPAEVGQQLNDRLRFS